MKGKTSATVKKKFEGSFMWVIKIGGSLLGSPELQRWLQIFAQYSDGTVVIVPGGGVFADAVREAQRLTKISDACAHRLAVMAMDQYGLLLANLNPLLATANSELEIAERTWQHRAIVWLPSKMVFSDDTISQSWDVTSDSLAAWLAQKLNAQHLLLIKSERPEGTVLSLKTLTDEGLVDEAFAQFVLNKSFDSWIIKKTDFVGFESGLNETTLTNTGAKLTA